MRTTTRSHRGALVGMVLVLELSGSGARAALPTGKPAPTLAGRSR
jgi:hypothetical protein